MIKDVIMESFVCPDEGKIQRAPFDAPLYFLRGIFMQFSLLGIRRAEFEPSLAGLSMQDTGTFTLMAWILGK